MSPLGFAPAGQIKSDVAASVSEDGTPYLVLKGHEAFVSSVAFSPDGKILASASQDKLIILWEPASGQAARTLQGHPGEVDSLSFSPDGTQLASGSFLGPAIVWDVNTGLQISKLNIGSSKFVAFSADGQTLVTGSADRAFTVWDAASGRVLRRSTGVVTNSKSLAFSPAGKIAAVGDLDGKVVLWDASSGVVLGSLKQSSHSLLRSLAFSPDGKTLAVGGYNSPSLGRCHPASFAVSGWRRYKQPGLFAGWACAGVRRIG